MHIFSPIRTSSSKALRPGRSGSCEAVLKTTKTVNKGARRNSAAEPCRRCCVSDMGRSASRRLWSVYFDHNTSTSHSTRQKRTMTLYRNSDHTETSKGTLVCYAHHRLAVTLPRPYNNPFDRSVLEPASSTFYSSVYLEGAYQQA